jgi:hypothetical protein
MDKIKHFTRGLYDYKGGRGRRRKWRIRRIKRRRKNIENRKK